MNDIYVCRHCGNEDIEERAWVKVNDHNSYRGCDENSLGYWCPNCGAYYEGFPMEQTEYQEKEYGNEG
jgi:hypothetical protein